MSDYLKKGFLLGLGAAISGKEKLDEMLKDLVEKNELTKDQAKSMMQQFIDKGDSKKEEWNDKQKDQIREWAKEYGLATKEDVAALIARIEALEEKITEND